MIQRGYGSVNRQVGTHPEMVTTLPEAGPTFINSGGARVGVGAGGEV